MDFTFGERHEAFRKEVRNFVRENLPEDIRRRREVTSYSGRHYKEDSLRWMQILHQRGWSVPAWPVEHGGQDWDPLQHFIFQEELHLAHAPVMNMQSIGLVGPIIYRFGSQAQKERFLGPIREGRSYWSQGFSEPGAGSDLANLRTRAELRGDRYIVNGQKIWTSGAYTADWGFFLVRTNPDVKPQQGISFLLIDLKSPGLTVRQIPQINGHASLCEVFLDNVEVPVENLVGEPGSGWDAAKSLLDHERTGSAFIFSSKRELARLRTMFERSARAADPVLRARLRRAEAQARALEWSVLRVLADDMAGRHPTAVASALKIRGADMQQALMQLQMDLLGELAIRQYSLEQVAAPPEPSSDWPDYVVGRTFSGLITRAATVYGGAKQVQLNIIAKNAFGL